MATSTLYDTKTVSISYSELKQIVEDAFPLKNWVDVSLADFFAQMTAAAFSDFKEELVAFLVGEIGLMVLTAKEIADLLNDSIKYAEMKPYLEKTTTASRIVITTYFYEWLSGSGNHVGYYTENRYTIVG